MKDIQNIIAIASGKGGVGKSTVSANLALALSARGARVGIMDADVYGPSIPTILGIREKPASAGENRLLPVTRYGLKVISLAFFIAPNEAVIWRGPMLHKIVKDFLEIVEWGALDYLIVDLPPGTGDVQLSLCQTIPITGAVIVSTPQDVAWSVAQRAITMFGKLNAPVLGVIENMSEFVCGHCGQKEELFGHGGARRAAERLSIPFLGEIPLVTGIRKTADEGDPLVHADPKNPVSQNFFRIAEALASRVKKAKEDESKKMAPSKMGPPNEKEFWIEWTDGKKSVYKPRDLRLACPCAACVDEETGKQILDPVRVADIVRVTSAVPVGRYALALGFSDGHKTGLYGFDHLRKIAQNTWSPTPAS